MVEVFCFYFFIANKNTEISLSTCTRPTGLRIYTIITHSPNPKSSVMLASPLGDLGSVRLPKVRRWRWHLSLTPNTHTHTRPSRDYLVVLCLLRHQSTAWHRREQELSSCIPFSWTWSPEMLFAGVAVGTGALLSAWNFIHILYLLSRLPASSLVLPAFSTDEGTSQAHWAPRRASRHYAQLSSSLQTAVVLSPPLPRGASLPPPFTLLSLLLL